jgi:FAD/FMN-containing dehydrogenase
MDRRHFLRMGVVSGVCALETTSSFAANANQVINDVSTLNPVRVAEVRQPRTTEDVQTALRNSAQSVSVGGGRFSMGGQIAATGSLHLDMRAMKGVVAFDPSRRRIRVQAGMTWRDVQDAIDPYDLSVKIMQSFSNFTVGGSVSVNCHGRYVGKGPIVNSVQAVQLVTAEGQVRELTRSHERDLFQAVFGSYGGLGVITEVELDLEGNARMERLVQDIAINQYPEFFREKILTDERVVLHNADLAPPDFAVPRMITWRITDETVTQTARLVPRGLSYNLEKNALWAISELPGGSRLRASVADNRLLGPRVVAWRNHEASLDTGSLEPRTRSMSTYLLQEYFIPSVNVLPFAEQMARILGARNVNALNVSIRHSPADTQTLMTWAPTEVFSFVLYYKQRSNMRGSSESALWTRELIDAALTNGGRYYLPYRLDATLVQFEQSYPEARAFAVLKSRIDPSKRFRNMLWDKYLPPV